MSKVTNVDFLKKAIIKNIDEVAESGARAAKTVSKEVVENNKTLLKEVADMYGVDDTTAKSILRKSNKSGNLPKPRSKPIDMDTELTKVIRNESAADLGAQIKSERLQRQRYLKREAELKEAFTGGAGIQLNGTDIMVPQNGTTHKKFSKLTPKEKKLWAEHSSEKARLQMELDDIAKNKDIIAQDISNHRVAPQGKYDHSKINNRESQRRMKEYQKELKREADKIRLEETKSERAKYIDDQMREAGMRGLSGSRPDAKQFSTKKLKGKMYDSKDDYMRYSAAKEHDEALKIFELKDKNPEKFEQKARNNPILNKMKGDSENYNNITKKKIEANRMEAIQNASADDMGLREVMGYNKVPSRVAAGASTFWLVNKLAESNGQQTNAQLYGQQPY